MVVSYVCTAAVVLAMIVSVEAVCDTTTDVPAATPQTTPPATVSAPTTLAITSSACWMFDVKNCYVPGTGNTLSLACPTFQGQAGITYSAGTTITGPTFSNTFVAPTLLEGQTLCITSHHARIILVPPFFPIFPMFIANNYQCTITSDPCGESFTTTSGSVTYPETSGTQYVNNLDCVWSFATTTGKLLELTFPTFSLESSSNCAKDYLEIESNANRFCGTTKPGTSGVYKTASTSVPLVFHTDDSVTNTGFQITWKTIDHPCGGSLTAATGTITYPDTAGPQYANNVDCVWTFTTMTGKILQLTFADFNLESSTSCAKDYLDVESNAHRFCGTTKPGTSGVYKTASTNVPLTFHTDGSVTDTGFQLTWANIDHTCGGSLTAATGTITYPDTAAGPQYANNVNCVWTFTTAAGKLLQLTFTTFSLESSTSCAKDYLDIESNANRFCGTTKPGTSGVYKTASTSVPLTFHTDATVTNTGFVLNWANIDHPCGGNFGVDSGSISYPDAAGPQYANNVDCVWTITTSTGKILQLTFTEFSLESTTGCTKDYLEIESSSNRFCGTTKPGTSGVYKTAGTTVPLTFHTDATVTNTGFVLSWTNIDHTCGGSSTSTTGNINYPDTAGPQYANNVDCTWTITTTVGKVVELTFTTFSLESSSPCVNDYLEIESSANRFCGTTLPGTSGVYKTSSNSITVKFHSDGSTTNTGFQITYATVDP